MNPLALAVELGSPASDLAPVLGLDLAELRAQGPAACDDDEVAERLSLWLHCLTWWRGYRCGDEGDVQVVGLIAIQLPALPVRFAADLSAGFDGWVPEATDDGCDGIEPDVRRVGPLRDREHEARQGRARGVRHGRARIDPGALVHAHQRVAAGESVRSVARDLGVAHTTLGRALRGETWG